MTSWDQKDIHLPSVLQTYLLEPYTLSSPRMSSATRPASYSILIHSFTCLRSTQRGLPLPRLPLHPRDLPLDHNRDIWACDKWKRSWSDKLCPKCTKRAKEKHQQGREAFWEGLPGLFRLPPWAELLKEREGMYVFNTYVSQPALTNPMQIMM